MALIPCYTYESLHILGTVLPELSEIELRKTTSFDLVFTLHCKICRRAKMKSSVHFSFFILAR